MSHHRLDVGSDNGLILRNVQRNHEGNYSCHVRNSLGSDQIVYQLFVQVPPGPPDVRIMSTNINSITLEWHVSGKNN